MLIITNICILAGHCVSVVREFVYILCMCISLFSFLLFSFGCLSIPFSLLVTTLGPFQVPLGSPWTTLDRLGLPRRSPWFVSIKINDNKSILAHRYCSPQHPFARKHSEETANALGSPSVTGVICRCRRIADESHVQFNRGIIVSRSSSNLSFCLAHNQCSMMYAIPLVCEHLNNVGNRLFA